MIKGEKHRRNEVAISTLANNIRKHRKLAGLSLEELANLIDRDYSQVSRMERSKVNPNVSIIWEIAAALKIKPSQLLEEE